MFFLFLVILRKLICRDDHKTVKDICFLFMKLKLKLVAWIFLLKKS